MQSGNLYVYGVGNPVAYVDRDGNIAFLVITALAGVAIGAIAGAIQSYVEYGEIHWENVAIGAGIGGIAGLAGGAVAGVVFAGSATASASVVIAGMGTTGAVAAGGTALAANQINTILSNVIPNRINHIMQTKHAWNLVGAEDWKTVSNIIGLVLTKGIGTLNSVGNAIYSFVYKGQVIEVTTRVVDGAVQLVDAWVKTR